MDSGRVLQQGVQHDKPADEKVSLFSVRNQGRASRLSLDLNVPLESWSDYTDPSVKKQDLCVRIRSPSVPAGELDRREKHFSGRGLSNVASSLGPDDAKVGLDLELKPPCRPEPRFNWLDTRHGNIDTDVVTVDLDLSLVSSCKEPESCDKGILQSIVTRNKSVSDYQQQEHATVGIGEASRSKMSSYDRKSASVKVFDCCDKREIDLNFPPIDTNSSVPVEGIEMLAALPQKVLSQDQRDMPESSPLLIDGVAMELEKEELNPPENALDRSDCKTATLDGSDSIPSKLASDKVDESDEDDEALEESENGDDAESGEEIVDYDYEQVIEEESCEDESDGSLDAADAGDTDYEEYEKLVEEVLDSCTHRDAGASSVPATGEDIQSSDECTKVKQSSDHYVKKTTVEKRPKIIPTSRTDQDWETKIIPTSRTDQDWETKRGRKESIVGAAEVVKATKEDVAELGFDPWETISSLKKDYVEGTENGNTKQGWRAWGTKSNDGHDAGRRESARRKHPAPCDDARRHEGPSKRSRIINLNNGSDRSSSVKEKTDCARPKRPRAERERFFGSKSFRRDKPYPGWHKHKDRNQSIQFGMRRSDYTWVRKDHGKNGANVEDAPLIASPGGRYTADFRVLEAREVRDLPSHGACYHSFSRRYQQYELQTENPWTNSSFRSAPRSLENSPRPWLGSDHKEMQQRSCQHAYYPQHMRDNNEGGTYPNVLQYRTNHPQQTHEETFRRLRYNHYGEQEQTTPAYSGRGVSGTNIRGRLGETSNSEQTGDAEYPRPRYGRAVDEILQGGGNPSRSGGNIGNRLGGGGRGRGSSCGARGGRGRGGNFRINGREACRDAESSEARAKRRKWEARLAAGDIKDRQLKQ